MITSVAAGASRIWVADAGSRKVAIFEPAGRLLGYLAPPDPFVAPSPFFDVAADPSGGVWVANPGCLRVEHYTAEGRRTTHWGQPSMEPAGFAGCCNPIHIALLSGGGFATSEKGIPRVKVYRADGSFAGVVAGPGTFAEDAHGLDLAARPTGDMAITIIGGVVLQEPGSVLDATAGPAGISGSINIQAPFQQLSGAIAPLPQAFAVATNLYGQRCAAEKGGQFSSFVQGARDGVPPQPGDLIPSPLMLDLDEVPLSSSLQSTSSL